MARTSPPMSGRRTGAVGLALWFLAGGAFRFEELSRLGIYRPHAMVLTASALAGVSDACVPLVGAWLVFRRPVGRRWRLVAAHILTAAALAALTGALDTTVSRRLGVTIGHAHLRGVAIRLGYYATVVAGLQAAAYLRRARDVATTAGRLRRTLARLEQQRLRAELRALKAELSPQFLDAALSRAGQLLVHDPGAARRVLAALAGAMRDLLARRDVAQVTLEDELSSLETFAPLVRAGDARVTVEHDVSADALDAYVPHLALASLLAHVAGKVLRSTSRSGHIVVSARVVAGVPERLHVVVRGRTAGIPCEDRDATEALVQLTAAEDLANLCRRLEQLYVGGSALLVTERVGDEVVAALTLPDPFVDAVLRSGHPEASPGERSTVPKRRERPVLARSVRSAHPQARATAGVLTAHDLDPVDLVGAATPPTAWTDQGTGARGAERRRAELRPSTAWIGIWVTVATLRLLARGQPLGTGPYPASAFWVYTVVRATSVTGVFWLAARATRHVPVDQGRVARAPMQYHGRMALAAAILFSACAVAARQLLHWRGDSVHREPLAGFAITQAIDAMVAYVVAAGVAHLALVRRERRARADLWRQMRATIAELATLRAGSELRALKAELNPHFVGNALHAAAALAASSPDAARRLVSTIQALAAQAAARTAVQEVVLAEELAELDTFLAIERARLGATGGLLEVVWDAAPDLLDVAVPHLALQPLVENAVRHGLVPNGGGMVRISARAGLGLEPTVSARRLVPAPAPRQDRPKAAHDDPPSVTGVLTIEVTDDGVGLRRAALEPRDASRVGASSPASGVGLGAGLGGLRTRLRVLYGETAHLDLVPNDGRGTTSRLTLPLRHVIAHA